jgi:16S rRNA (cytosine967-C5)-methyltransferase
MNPPSHRRTTEHRPSGQGRVAPARQAALETLIALRSGGFAEHVLFRQLERQRLGSDDRALTTELVYGVLRWRDRLDAIIGRLLDRPHRHVNAVMRDILRLGLYQIAMLERIPDHAVVHQAVLQCRAGMGHKAAAFVNGVLRRFAREREALDPPPSDEPDSLAVYYSHPLWLVRHWVERFGHEATVGILVQNNSRAPLMLRVNALKSTPVEVATLLGDHGVSVSAMEGMPYALILSEVREAVPNLPGFQEGLFTVQEAASQMIAPLVHAQAGLRILDACAAPGGKTAHLAALTRNEASIVAMDASRHRLDQARGNLARLGVTSAECVFGDAASSDFVIGLGAFDRMLIDAPCSNLGVLRHNPDAKYRLQPHDLTELAARQRVLLANASRALKPGGIVVYAVCTPMDEETMAVIDGFLAERKDFVPEPIRESEVPYPEYLHDRGVLRTFPPTAEHPVDGFFAARFRRL